ncbi:MAG: putative inner membrane transporter YhbE [Cellvibrionales bacterium UBA7375]|nr:MAG: putative inner membrane transporter YhbE [Cellvibrionales bacterium UBA7375]
MSKLNALSGRWKLGLLLALGTATMWGTLPVALHQVAPTIGPATSTFFRFFIAALLLTPYLLVTRQVNNPNKLKSAKLLALTLAAGLLLTGNYGFYILGLQRTSAEATQVMIQLAPMLLLLAGLWLFKETFSTKQWLGFFAFALGLLLFFERQISQLLFDFGDYGLGLVFIIMSAIFWTGYAIIQKYLLNDFKSSETMLILYWIGSLVFLPLSDFSTMGQLNSLQWAALLFCGLNTLIAYGCFAEAMVHLEASRVSAIIAITPLFTIAIAQLLPIGDMPVEPLTALSILGAILVVSGSITTAIAKKS